METEEHEQIPWSHLVAEAEQPVDKRVYLAAAAVAVVALAFIGLRFFGSDGPATVAAGDSTPVVDENTEPVLSDTQPQVPALVTPTTVGAITEADP